MNPLVLASRLQRIVRGLIPREENFFELFEELGDHAGRAAMLLSTIYAVPKRAAEVYPKLKKVEEAADDCLRQIHEKLNRTFVTPIDREDIAMLAGHLDDIVDNIESVGKRVTLLAGHLDGSLELFDLFLNPSRSLLGVLVAATNELPTALAGLKKSERIPNPHSNIHRLENRGDKHWEGEAGFLDLFYGHFAKRRNDSLTGEDLLLIEWKEICHSIERAIDHIKNTVDCVSGIIEKFA